MEKKEPIKVSLSTVFLIIAIIVIVIMGYFVCKFYNDKVEGANKVNDLQKQVGNLNGTINDLQGKINSINDAINTNKTSEKTETNINANINVEFTNEEVKKAISDYLELYSSAACGTPLDFLKEKGKINYYDPFKNVINTTNGEITTNVKFSDYKKAMLNYITENEFERNWTTKIGLIENSNGYLTHGQLGGGFRNYTIRDIAKIDTNKYSVKATSIVEDDDSTRENNSFIFELKNYNNNCVIDSCK